MKKIESLMEQLDTPGDTAAEKVIAALAKIGKPALPFLRAAAKDTANPRIRKWSLQALGSFGEKKDAILLIEALKEDRMTVRLHAVKGLARLGMGAEPIAKLLKDESGGIRVNALYALMVIGDVSVLPEIRKCLKDSEWYVRQNACVACGKFADVKAKRELKRLSTEDERKAVRDAAKVAFDRL